MIDVQPYRCTECNQRFSQSGLLLDHLRLHISDGIFRCSLCPKIFETGPTLKCHVTKTHVRCHAKGEVLVCTICKKEYVYAKRLLHHVWTHVQKESKINLSEKLKMVNKVEEIHSDRMWKDSTFNSLTGNVQNGEKLKNMNVFHEDVASTKRFIQSSQNCKPFKCSVCCRRFSKQRYLTRHVNWHKDQQKAGEALSDKDSYVESCQQTISSDLKMHRMLKHPQLFSCDVCQRKYPTKFGLYFHTVVHMKGGHSYCFICKLKFPSKSLLKHHHQRFHSQKIQLNQNSLSKLKNLDTKTLSCNFCCKKLSASSIRKHDGVYLCELCFKQFKHLSQYKRQCTILQHTQPGKQPERELKIVNEKCLVDEGKLKGSLSLLEKQVEEYEGLNSKYRCRLLQRMKDPGWMKRKFPCTVCPWRFKNLSHLTDHLESFHLVDGRQYTCPVCGSKFKLSRLLNNHLKEHVDNE